MKAPRSRWLLRNPRSGPLASLGWLFTPQAMIVAQTLIALPLVTGLTMSAVASVPPELPLQVRSLGASPWQARRAALREARLGVVVALAAGFGRIIAEVGAALMVGGDIQGHTRVLTTANALRAPESMCCATRPAGDIINCTRLAIRSRIAGGAPL